MMWTWSSRISYFLRTLWLFTLSDIKTFVIPETAFGILSALSGPAVTTVPNPRLGPILARVAHTVTWTWLNTLLFTLANQRLPASIVEDKLNKPSRPLPAGRITSTQTRRLLMVSIPAVVLVTIFLGGQEETLILIALTWIYNDLGGADENYLVRNLINGFAHPAYSAGATKVACGNTLCALNKAGYKWVAMIGAVIFSTLQVQDLKDQEGDRARGRSTAPLVLGSRVARWTVAVPVMVWSMVCPTYWMLDVWGFIAPVTLGCLVVVRLFLWRDVAADRLTWKFWSLWMMSLYLLPLLKDHRVFEQVAEEWGIY